MTARKRTAPVAGLCRGIEWCPRHAGVALEGTDSWDRCDMAPPDEADSCDLRTVVYLPRMRR